MALKNRADDPTHTILGFSSDNEIIESPVSKFPHALIAGATGSGKSVFIECILTSMMVHAVPEELKLIIVDPKGNEFGNYKDLPFMMCNPITDKDKAPDSLAYLAEEMDVRFQKFNKYGAKLGLSIKNLSHFNDLVDRGKIKDEPKMPYIVLLVDELFDLMSTHKDSVEMSIKRLGAKARASGIHMILATQTPRKEVVTGLIKANVPTKISLMASSSTESMIILGQTGAEKLKPHGDFYASINNGGLVRGQGGFVDSEEELAPIFKYIRKHYPKPKLLDITEALEDKKEEHRRIIAEIEGVPVDEIDESIEDSADKFHNSNAQDTKEKTEVDKEKEARREQNEKMMKQIEANRKNKSKESKRVSIDMSKYTLDARNEEREKQGEKPITKRKGVVGMASSQSKKQNVSNDKKATKQKETPQKEAVRHTEGHTSTKEVPPKQTRTSEHKKPVQQKQSDAQPSTTSRVQNQPSDTMQNRRNQAKNNATRRRGSSPLARKRS